MRRLVAVLAIVWSTAIGVPGAASADAGCGFQLGFKAIAERIPDVVGQCAENEHPDGPNVVQHTAGGLLVWRKADNFTAFTDGYRSCVNGPVGLQQRLNTERFDWEAAAPVVDPSAVASGLVKVGGVCYELGEEPGGFYARLAQQYHYAHAAHPRDCGVPVQPSPPASASRALTCYADRTGYVYCG